MSDLPQSSSSTQDLEARLPGENAIAGCPLTPKPDNEVARQAALDRYELVGTLPERAFDDLTVIVTQICQTPLAFISLISGEIQWLKAEVGIGTQALSRQGSFCGYTILNPERTLIVPDASEDPRFQYSPFVVGPPHIRFYAGAPLVTPDGYAVGSLCAVDLKPRLDMDGKQIASLEALARQVVDEMELHWTVKKLEREISRRKAAEQDLQKEQAKSEKLIENMLPASVARRLKDSPGPIADRVDDVAILFADLVNFTCLASQVDPQGLVGLLNGLFCAFDNVVSADRNLEKIKTIGDAYMVAAGLTQRDGNYISSIADVALHMQEATQEFSRLHLAGLGIEPDYTLNLRLGLEVGSVVAGTIGKVRYAYDLWGDTVNLASRLESQGMPGKIQIGPQAYQHLRDRYSCQSRGKIDLKGKGSIETYWLEGRREAVG